MLERINTIRHVLTTQSEKNAAKKKKMPPPQRRVWGDTHWTGCVCKASERKILFVCAYVWIIVYDLIVLGCWTVGCLVAVRWTQIVKQANSKPHTHTHFTQSHTRARIRFPCQRENKHKYQKWNKNDGEIGKKIYGKILRGYELAVKQSESGSFHIRTQLVHLAWHSFECE